VLSPGKGEVKPAKQVQVPRQDDTCVWAVIDPLWLQVIPRKESMALCWSVHYLQAPHPLPLQCIWQYSLQHLTWVDIASAAFPSKLREIHVLCPHP
jgi:hypothetical protein